ncbi:MAG: iron-sulfur cluster assembly scaffold protein [Chloroflexi bacterium]|nr:MAG: iron-sulfur cluster assembly scaffold protein [Chloroflexota bacterium]
MDTNIYHERMIDLYEHPLNFGTIENADFSYEDDNPLCGDVIRIDVRLDGENQVSEVAWSGEGCVVCLSSASLLTEEIKGMPLSEVKSFSKERLLALIGVKLNKVRIKCAILSLNVLKAGANQMPDD